MPALPTRPLGTTGLTVPRLGLGGHTFLKRFGGSDRPGREALQAILQAAMDAGVTFLDATYDEERELLGQVLKDSGRRDEALVSSWAQAKHTPDGPATMRECERALAQMQLECLDHFYVEVPITDEQAEALATLKRDGKIRAAGVLGPERARAAGREKIDVAVGVYNFYRQGHAEDFAALKAADIGVLAVEPLGRGRFIRESPQDAPRIVSALLRFALAHRHIDGVIVTMTSLEQIASNVAAALGPAPSDEDLKLLQAGRGYEIAFDPWK
ncbi:MAG: aldo/keto reductase [Planctomycetota bacterium]|nr:aldo/keto reductase [Planctomycetota bacterium]